MKRVRGTAPFVQGKGRKMAKTILKKRKEDMVREKTSLAIPRAILKGKGRINNQNDIQTKQREKKRKGFEKKLLVAIPKNQEPFWRQRKEK